MGNKKILVVEDNPLNMKLVKQLLIIGKYEVLEARDAETGIELARRHLPDMILIDIQLPGMDGLTATRELKKDPQLKDTPVIALTAYAMDGDELKGKAAGCCGYITKPIDTKSFFKTVENYLRESVGEVSGLPRETAMEKGYQHTILIVDDEPLNVKLLAAKLATSGYRIRTAFSGQECLDKVHEKIPDLILLDIMMPGMDGYEVIDRLKRSEETCHIPIVLVTALDGKEEKARGLAAGADEFLNKPVNTAELEARVMSLLRLKKYKEQLNSRIKSEQQLLNTDQLRHHSATREDLPTVLVVEDNPRDARLILEYLHGLPLLVKVAETGETARKILVRQSVDLILLDVLLPDMDGLDICRQIKRKDTTMSIQIVVVTTLDDLKIKIKGVEIGADDFLLKPLNREEIRARVVALLKKKAYMDRLNQRADSAMKAAITDKLTGVYNYSFFKYFLDLEIKRSLRQGSSLALLMIDVDDFKTFNDSYGHPAGDYALSTLGGLLRENIREVDLAARYGGEEFAVVLPYARRADAEAIARRLLDAVGDLPLQLPGTDACGARISVSIGIGVFPEDSTTAEALVGASDTALYRAKKEGKKRVCICGQ